MQFQQPDRYDLPRRLRHEYPPGSGDRTWGLASPSASGLLKGSWEVAARVVNKVTILLIAYYNPNYGTYNLAVLAKSHDLASRHGYLCVAGRSIAAVPLESVRTSYYLKPFKHIRSLGLKQTTPHSTQALDNGFTFSAASAEGDFKRSLND